MSDVKRYAITNAARPCRKCGTLNDNWGAVINQEHGHLVDGADHDALAAELQAAKDRNIKLIADYGLLEHKLAEEQIKRAETVAIVDALRAALERARNEAFYAGDGSTQQFLREMRLSVIRICDEARRGTERTLLTDSVRNTERTAYPKTTMDNEGAVHFASHTVQPTAALPIDGLVDFARDMARVAWDAGSLDGYDVQEMLTAHGILIETEVAGPCSEETCGCAEVTDEWPTTCFRLHPALSPTVQTSESQRTCIDCGKSILLVEVWQWRTLNRNYTPLCRACFDVRQAQDKTPAGPTK
jgi:hypothetical protein